MRSRNGAKERTRFVAAKLKTRVESPASRSRMSDMSRSTTAPGSRASHSANHARLSTHQWSAQLSKHACPRPIPHTKHAKQCSGPRTFGGVVEQAGREQQEARQQLALDLRACIRHGHKATQSAGWPCDKGCTARRCTFAFIRLLGHRGDHGLELAKHASCQSSENQ